MFQYCLKFVTSRFLKTHLFSKKKNGQKEASPKLCSSVKQIQFLGQNLNYLYLQTFLCNLSYLNVILHLAKESYFLLADKTMLLKRR